MRGLKSNELVDINVMLFSEHDADRLCGGLALGRCADNVCAPADFPVEPLAGRLRRAWSVGLRS